MDFRNGIRHYGTYQNVDGWRGQYTDTYGRYERNFFFNKVLRYEEGLNPDSRQVDLLRV